MRICYIGVEIGGTKQQIALGSADGTILERRQVRLGSETRAETILRWIESTVKELRQAYPVSAIGVGFGGPIDPVTETIVCSLQVPGWEGLPLGRWFRDTFGLPAIVRNDTVTGGLGELYRGAGQGSRRFFYTNIGTGIGGGAEAVGSDITVTDGEVTATGSKSGAGRLRRQFPGLRLGAGLASGRRRDSHPAGIPVRRPHDRGQAEHAGLCPFGLGAGSPLRTPVLPGTGPSRPARRCLCRRGAGPDRQDLLHGTGGCAGSGFSRSNRSRRRRGKNGRHPF